MDIYSKKYLTVILNPNKLSFREVIPLKLWSALKEKSYCIFSSEKLHLFRWDFQPKKLQLQLQLFWQITKKLKGKVATFPGGIPPEKVLTSGQLTLQLFPSTFPVNFSLDPPPGHRPLAGIRCGALGISADYSGIGTPSPQAP